MANSAEFPEVLKNHYQLNEWSCAASAFECIAKLHGLIPHDAFPLQSAINNQKKGFADQEFLRSLGLSPTESHHETQSAMALIERETSEGRFPAISLICQSERGELVYHTYICGLHNTKLLLIDPANCKTLADKKTDLANILENNRQKNPERKTLHILSYEISDGLQSGAVTPGGKDSLGESAKAAIARHERISKQKP